MTGVSFHLLSEQCKETKENNRMGKTRDLLKKIRDTKGTFHAKIGTIKDRNGMDLTEAEDIGRGGKNTQNNCTKKGLNDPDNHNGVITHLRARHPGVWGHVGQRKHYYKGVGGDGIPAEPFQVLKDDAVKVLHSICRQIWKIQQWPQDWKRCFHSNPKERQCQRMLKLPLSCTHLTC